METINENAFTKALREFDEADRQSHGGGEFNAEEIKAMYIRNGRLK